MSFLSRPSVNKSRVGSPSVTSWSRELMAPVQRLLPSRGCCGSSWSYFLNDASTHVRDTDGDPQQLDCLRSTLTVVALGMPKYTTTLAATMAKTFELTTKVVSAFLRFSHSSFSTSPFWGVVDDYVCLVLLLHRFHHGMPVSFRGGPQGLRQAKSSVTHLFTSVDSSHFQKLSLDLDLQVTMLLLAQV
jgi:hypothetical protein